MSPRPNLLFVFSDQQSWDMLSCYGNRDLKTPSFDRLAAGGVRFNHSREANTPVGQETFNLQSLFRGFECS
jgi:hypothetical protein